MLQEACDEACSTAITVAARKALERHCKDNQAQLSKLWHKLALHIFGQPYEKGWSAMRQVRRHVHWGGWQAALMRRFGLGIVCFTTTGFRGR